MTIPDLIRSPNLSADFLADAVAQRLRVNIDGTTIVRNGTGQLVAAPLQGTTSSFVNETSSLAVGTVTAGQDINDNAAIEFTSARADTGWVIAGNAATYTGSPDRVRIDVIVPQEIDQALSIQRPSPQLNLLRNGVIIAESKTGYIRDATDHEESSNTIAFVDGTPGTDPVYTLESVQESSNGGVVSVSPVGGSAAFEAVELETITYVNTAVPAGAGTTACAITAGPYTGTESGVFVDGCQIIDLAGASDPGTVVAASAFPVRWRQAFDNGVTGSETWTVETDANGVNQWTQVT